MNTFINYLLILVLTDIVNSQKILNILPETYAKATSVHYDFSPEYVTNVTGQLKPINWQRSVLNLEGDLVQDLRNITVNLQLFKYTNQFRPFLLNITFNFCKLFENVRTGNPYLQTVLNIVDKFSNYFHKCPHRGHVYLRGAYLDFCLIHFRIPTGTFKLVAKFYEGWPLDQFGVLSYPFKVAEVKNVTRSIVNRG